PLIGIQPFLPPVVTGLTAGGAAQKAGIALDDLITEVSGTPVTTFSEVVGLVRASGGKALSMRVDRNGQAVSFTLTPEAKPDGAGGTVFQIGIMSDPTQPNSRVQIETVYHDPASALSKGVSDVGFIIYKIGEFFGQLVTGTGDVRQLSGPIGIAKVSSEAAQSGVLYLIHLIAVLSVSIGLLNLLPIPVLDGGHLLYYAIESIRGKPLGETAQQVGFQIGLAFVLGLMVVATWNDIVKMVF
ncbi:MAG TPA: RIP metalloprotease RseP, partial [Alphaproteobacteria bacterium]|nr:RIP metalloprotease RseP [Alphaproteobacteria bacterium]